MQVPAYLRKKEDSSAGAGVVVSSADLSGKDLTIAGAKQPEQSQIQKPRKKLKPIRGKRFYSGGLDRY